MESVFEVVDHTDDEVYYTLGLFHSLKEANAAIDEFVDDPPRSEASCIEDVVVVEIRERKFGWDEPPFKKTTRREFRCSYQGETDDGVWKEVTQPQEQGA